MTVVSIERFKDLGKKSFNAENI